MAEGGLAGYASPHLRAAIFNRLFPGSQVYWSEPLPIEDCFPIGWREYEGKATHAICCTIERSDGCVFVAYKEIDVIDKNRQQPQTPENLAKNETKAFGRALTKAGIPMHINELQSLMRWVVALEGTNPPPARPTNVDDNGEIRGSADPDGDDPVDDDRLTLEQEAAAAFGELPGPLRVAVNREAKDRGIMNVMRCGERAAELLTIIRAAQENPDE